MTLTLPTMLSTSIVAGLNCAGSRFPHNRSICDLITVLAASSEAAVPAGPIADDVPGTFDHHPPLGEAREENADKPSSDGVETYICSDTSLPREHGHPFHDGRVDFALFGDSTGGTELGSNRLGQRQFLRLDTGQYRPQTESGASVSMPGKDLQNPQAVERGGQHDSHNTSRGAHAIRDAPRAGLFRSRHRC